MSKQNQTQNQQQAEPVQAKTAKQEIQGIETAVILPFPSLQRAHNNPRTISSADAALLQRTIGNQALGRLTIQRKMTVGPVGDKYEQEADAVAKQVVGKLNTPSPQTAPAQTAQRQEEEELQMKPLVQRQEEEELQMKSIQRQEEEDELQMKPLPSISSVQRQEEEELQMKPLVQRQEEEEELQAKSETTTGDPMLAGGELGGDVESSVQSAKSGGQPMADNLRGPMEQAFNADFSNVKIHADSQANMLNRSLSARAFTTGQDVFFRNGEYNPSSSSGQELLAHELTHVVQQKGAAVQRKLASNIIQRAKPTTKAFSQERSLTNKLEKAVRNDENKEASTHATALFNHNNIYYLKLLEYKLNKHEGNNAAKYKLYKGENPGLPAFQASWQHRNQFPSVTKALSNLIVFLPATAQADLAQEDPDFFLDHILKAWKQDIQLSSQLLQLLEQALVRNILRTSIPAKWRAFAAEIPQFSVSESIYEEVISTGLVLNDEAIIDRIFEAVVANRNIDIGYFTNNLAPLDTVPSILRGATAEEKAARIERARVDVTKPDKPSAQCDNLMKILHKVVEMYPGLNTTFAIGMEQQALLTVPLNTLPGGLIPKTFKGNVVDQTGNYTNQIFFTGVTESNEPRSHTWNVIGGKAYDSVLGTKGAEVAASKAFAFTQRKNDGDQYEKTWVSGTKTLTMITNKKAADNTLGFQTAYQRNW